MSAQTLNLDSSHSDRGVLRLVNSGREVRTSDPVRLKVAKDADALLGRIRARKAELEKARR